MHSSSFDELERSLQKQIASIRNKAEQAVHMNEEGRLKQRATLQREMEKLGAIFTSMDIQARTNADASVLLLRVNRSRHEISQLEKDVARVVPAVSSKKVQDSLEEKKADQRTHLIEGHQKIEQTTSNLHDTHSVALETEQLGEGALSEMARQRAIFEAGITELDDVDSHVDGIRNVLSSMGRRLITDKFILSFIVVLLVLAIGFVIGWKWIRPLFVPK